MCLTISPFNIICRHPKEPTDCGNGRTEMKNGIYDLRLFRPAHKPRADVRRNEELRRDNTRNASKYYVLFRAAGLFTLPSHTSFFVFLPPDKKNNHLIQKCY